MRQLILLCAIALLVACSIEKRGAPGTEPNTTLDLSSEADSVSVTLYAPRVARRGDQVPVIISVRNTSPRTLELALTGREIAFDITVTQHNGAVVYQRLYGQTIPAILQLKKLVPEEAFELKDVWHANVPPGEYDVTGKVLTDAKPLETNSVRVKIE